MKHILTTACAAACAGALLHVACAMGASAAAFADPLDTPARASPLAQRTLVNGLAHAGTRVVAAGQRGHILVSDDRGASWRQANVPVAADLTAVAFADAKLGWAVGHDGVILHSRDGGGTWSRQADGRAEAQQQGQVRPLLDLWFDDAEHGMAVGAFGLALCTADGGGHWRHCENQLDNPNGLHLNAIRKVGGAVYIAGEQGLLLKRGADGRFAALPSPYKGSFFGVTGNAATVVVFGLRGNAYASTDGGQSWRRATTGVQTGLTAGAALDGGALALVSQSGQLLLSRDGGATFTPEKVTKPQPAAAALALPGGGLVIGGVRGLYAHVPSATQATN